MPALLAQHVVDWLTPQLPDGIPAVRGELVPDAPDQVVVVTMTGGPGLLLEQLMDGVTFQARTRGQQCPAGDDGSAEDLAMLVDALVVDVPLPAQVGPVRVARVDRVGGRPSFLLRDSARRAHYIGNYLLLTGRL